jgi:hypothetical protein
MEEKLSICKGKKSYNSLMSDPLYKTSHYVANDNIQKLKCFHNNETWPLSDSVSVQSAQSGIPVAGWHLMVMHSLHRQTDTFTSRTKVLSVGLMHYNMGQSYFHILSQALYAWPGPNYNHIVPKQ